MDGWVATWGCALQPADQANGPELAGAILRQTIRVSIGGSRARLLLSNEYGEHPLELGAVAVSRPRDGRAGAAALDPTSSVLLTFGGSAAVAIPPGGRAASDPFDFLIESRSILTVTTHVRSAVAPLATHPGSRTTSHVLAATAHPRDLEPVEAVAAPELPHATPVVQWYLLAALEVSPYRQASASGAAAPAAVVCLGDSLTDGRGSTTDGNDRWPDALADRLHTGGRTHVAVVNQGVGGGRLLRDGLGIAALRRLDRDVLGCAGVRWLIVFAGVNDIGTAEATPEAQRLIGDELLAGYAELVDRARTRGIRAYGATLTPFGGHDYDDPAGQREQVRQRVNTWIRESSEFDAVIDFDRVVRDAGDHRLARRSLHDGDGLHLNPAGYRAIADAVPPDLFS